jgi:hypothetical protein
MASFTKVKVPGEKAESALIYYNATIINNTVATNILEEEPFITFSESRQNPIILDCSKYKVSVQNFSLNGASKTLPVFIPQINPTGGSITQTIYTIRLGFYSGALDEYFTVGTRIVWEPEDVSSFLQIPTQVFPQEETSYYYCYTYSHWVNLMNKALRTAWNSIRDDVDPLLAAQALPPTSWQCPFFEFNENTGLFSLSQDANTSMCPYGTALPAPFNFTSTAAGYTAGDYSWAGMNENLQGLMTNFNDTYFGVSKAWRSSTKILAEFIFDFGLTNLGVTTGTVNGSNVLSLLNSKPASFFIVNPFTNDEDTSKAFVKSTQNFVSTGGIWSPVASIVLGTSQLPVRNEFVANVVSVSGRNTGTNNRSDSAFQKVLLETPINAVTADILRGWILYQPLVPTYTMLEDSKVAIANIDISVFWRNRLTNSLVPLRMYNSSTMTIRLLFERHDVV